MNVSAPLANYLTSIEGKTNLIREAWDRLSGLPAGKRVFSHLVGHMAPYTGSISARIRVLELGHATVELDDKKSVRNHLNCIHAIALCNLAELAGNIALAYSLPNDARFIVAGLSIEYLKKARGRLTATCDCPVPASCAREEFPVEVVIRDRSGEVVCRATLRTLVGPKINNESRSGDSAPVISIS